MESMSPINNLEPQSDAAYLKTNIMNESFSPNQLRAILIEICKRKTANTNIADAKAIERISSEFEILVFGPPRVGKSTLIKELSGDEEIRTSAGLNTCTAKTAVYTDQFGLKWWDTCGIEKWTEKEADQFLKETFFDRKIIPRAAIFCRTSGALANTSIVKNLFRTLESHGATLFYVITRWPFLAKRERLSIANEAIELLGGGSIGISPYEETSMNTNQQNVEVAKCWSGGGCFGYCRGSQSVRTNAVAPSLATPSSAMLYRALECKANSSYIVPVNSLADKITGNSVSTEIPVMNITFLRQLILTKTCRGDSRDERLMDLNKKQMSLLSTIGYHIFEVLDDIGFGIALSGLNQKEKETYQAVKEGGKNQHIAAPMVKAILNKVLSSWH